MSVNHCLSICPLVCIIGDSTVINHYYYLPQHKYSRITSLATSGETISMQKARWSALSQAKKQSFDYVIVQVGINDAKIGGTTVVVAAYQDLINTINSETKADVRVIGCAMTPIREAFEGAGYAGWLYLNNAIMQISNSISGLWASCDSYNDIIGDENDYLLVAYDDGTHFHPNAAGNNINCEEISKIMLP